MLTDVHGAFAYMQAIADALNDLLGELDANDDLATWHRSKFKLIKNREFWINGGRALSDGGERTDKKEEKPAEGRGENGILKLNEKEIEEMPDLFRRLYENGVFIPHVRTQRNGSIEIRCQIRGIKITATAKTLALAKKKFV